MESKIEHLKMIQGIITRMNTNSFQIKGWTITLVSALLALYANSRKVTYIFIALIPVLIFWFLDSYYLQQERKFRELYKEIVNTAHYGTDMYYPYDYKIWQYSESGRVNGISSAVDLNISFEEWE